MFGAQTKKNSSKLPIYSIFLRFLKKRGAMFIGSLIVFTLIFISIFAPMLSPYDPEEMYWGQEYTPPNSRYLLGTDILGRDVYSRIIWGARSSLKVGLLSTLIATVIGVFLGCISGYYGGIIDNSIMRMTDILMSFPGFFLFLFIFSILRVRSFLGIIVILGLIRWTAIARITRSKVLSVKEETFVEAAKGLGGKDFHIIFRHILPNSLGPIIVTSTLMIANNIMTESGLCFLGAGDPTVISWGFMLALGREVIRSAWWVSTFPGLAIFLTTLGFNLLGDGIRDMIGEREE